MFHKLFQMFVYRRRGVWWIFEKLCLMFEYLMSLLNGKFFRKIQEKLKNFSSKSCLGCLHQIKDSSQMFIFPLMILDDFPFWNLRKKQENCGVLTALIMTIKVYELSSVCHVIYDFTRNSLPVISNIEHNTIISNCLNFWCLLYTTEIAPQQHSHQKRRCKQ